MNLTLYEKFSLVRAIIYRFISRKILKEKSIDAIVIVTRANADGISEINLMGLASRFVLGDFEREGFDGCARACLFRVIYNVSSRMRKVKWSAVRVVSPS